MRLGISTGACFPFLSSRLKQIELLSDFAGIVDGIEVILPRPRDLMQFGQGKRALELLKEFGFVNIHYPFGKYLKYSRIPEKKLVRKLVQLEKAIGFSNLILHPGTVNNWQDFQKINATVLIENQSAGENKPWQSPVAMKSILKETGFGMCLDLNHAMSCNIKPANFLSLKGKIKQLHVTSTNSLGKDEHRFLADSPPKSLKLIKPVLKEMKRATWIIESKSARNPRKKLEQEIELLKRI